MPQSVPSPLAALVGLLHTRTVIILALIFCAGVGSTIWYVSRVQANLIESTTLQHASLYAQALAEFRTLYTSEVVERARIHGIEVTHDYSTKEAAIPLPATLSILLGERIGEHQAGAQVRLYSAYPFPWRRETSGLRDNFEEQAWEHLRQNPGKAFLRFENFGGRRSLRYAIADRMRPDCVNCHNKHPASPKTDWKTGDVRGVLEVILPLDTAVANVQAGLRGTVALLSVMSVLVLLGLALVIRRLQRSSVESSQRASELEGEITERKRAEEALQYRVVSERIITGILTHFINVESDEIDSGINRALRRVGEFAGADRSYLFQFSDAGTKMDNTHEWCAPGIEPQIQERQGMTVKAFSWFTEQLQLMDAVHIPCVAEMSSDEGSGGKEANPWRSAQSLLYVPVAYGGRPVGFIGLETVRQKKEWPEENITLLRIVGDILVNALERKRAEERIRAALAESEQSRHELERFDRFAVGRELRMVELKKQVNALLESRGEPTLYDVEAMEKEGRGDR